MTNFAGRTIWTGDNLDILRGLHSASVDLIYLDPPFNSNRNYAAPVGSTAAGAAFKDTWTLSDLDVAWMGLIADEQPAMYQVLQAAGLTHGKGMQSYLCMMAVRLLEMRRVLKETGSIYLHCDPTASHYLKLLMDSIYGQSNFHNEIVWKRTSGRSGAHGFGRVHDTILFYCKTETFTWNPQWLPLSEEHIRRAYRNEDERGRWQSDQLTARGLRTGESGEPWRGVDPSDVGRHWATPTQGAMHDYIIDQGLISGWPDDHPGSMIVLTRWMVQAWSIGPMTGTECRGSNGTLPRRRVPQWRTSSPISRQSAPSSRAHRLPDPETSRASGAHHQGVLRRGRRGPGPVLRLRHRLRRRREPGPALDRHRHLAKGCRVGQHAPAAVHGRPVPQPADHCPHRHPQAHRHRCPVPYRQNKHVLFGQQEGRCNGCRSEFPFRVLEVDNVIRNAPAARTTSRTCSCSAPTATASRATGRRSTWRPG